MFILQENVFEGWKPQNFKRKYPHILWTPAYLSWKWWGHGWCRIVGGVWVGGDTEVCQIRLEVNYQSCSGPGLGQSSISQQHHQHPAQQTTANNSKYLLYFKTGKLEARSMCLLSCTLCHRQQSTRATLLDNWKAPSDPINSISRQWLLLLVVPSFLFGIPILVIIRRRAPDTVLIWSCSVLFRSSINNPTWRSFYAPAFCSPRQSSLCWKWK